MFQMVLNVDGAISQLKSIYQNGYIRQNHHTIPRQSNKSSYLHHQHHHNMQVIIMGTPRNSCRCFGNFKFGRAPFFFGNFQRAVRMLLTNYFVW